MADHSHAAPGAHAHAGHAHEEHHPGFSTYWKVALILTIITIVEVAAYYIPAWENSWVYVPSMLLMSGVKFYIVVAYYMHLKYDNKLFRALFTGPLVVAALTLTGLLFLFSKLVLRLGIIS